jgi:unsaturated chondroitin disaccharide hydrolase
MKKSYILLLLVFLPLLASAQTLDVDKQLNYCHTQILRALKDLRQSDGSYDYSKEPRNILATDKQKGWNCRPATAEEWCGGFWPGILWMDYSLTKDENIENAAEGYTQALRHIAYEPIFDHDIGFLMFCSFGKGYEATHNADYKKIIFASADSLATLFNPHGRHNPLLAPQREDVRWAQHHHGQHDEPRHDVLGCKERRQPIAL